MLKITGYSDKYTAHPGEEVKFYINAENNDKFDVQLVDLYMEIQTLRVRDIRKKKLAHPVMEPIKVRIKEFMVGLI